MEMADQKSTYPFDREDVESLERDNAQLRAALARWAAEAMLTRIQVSDAKGVGHSGYCESRKYTASDGSVWDLAYGPKPIPTKAHDWSAVHDEYDGPGDTRHVDAATLEGVIAAVEEYLYENPEQRREAEEA